MDLQGDGYEDDSFGFVLTKEEFLNYFFDDLELPNMQDKDITIIDELKIRRAGYSSDGTPSRLDILRSMKEAVGRRFALSADERKRMTEIQDQITLLNAEIYELKTHDKDPSELEKKRDILEEEIMEIRRGITIPFVDDLDLRYRQWVVEPVPATQAVMFCIMDVSGSMSEMHKDLAKRFFMLLYLFLFRNYDHIELVFIRHHTDAREVNEHDFFYAKDSGGTVVSRALELMKKIAKLRYNTHNWNIYVAHASDGDAWWDDISVTQEHFREILKLVQFYFYIEISQRQNSELKQCFEEIKADNYAMAQIGDASEIFPVFEGLFKKRG